MVHKMKILLLLTSSILISPISVMANEMISNSWDFPTSEQTIISQNRLLLFCDANPKKCPDSIFFSRRGGSGGGGGGGIGGGDSLVHPTTTASANNITVVLSGDNSAVNLDTSQDSEGNNLNSQSETSPTIDYDEVLNITNNDVENNGDQ